MNRFNPGHFSVVVLLSWLVLSACSPDAKNTRQPPSPPPSTPDVAVRATPLPKIVRLDTQSRDQAPWLKSDYLSALQGEGVSLSTQGLWVQSRDQVLATYQASEPFSAASITKLATTLTALHRLGPTYRFVTQLGVQGSIKNRTLEGNLVIAGGDDPFFVWEDAIAIANLLSEQGIDKITGDLLIQGPFTMNFETDSALSGVRFQQSLKSETWPDEAIAQFQTLPPTTAKPNIQLQGQVRLVDQVPETTVWKLKHSSLPLVELLKRMNRYSNNPMAEQIAQHLGGAHVITEVVRQLTGLPSGEVQFVNGSGLGVENRISAQGATLLLQALSNQLQAQGMSLGDVLTIVGQDEGVLDHRALPKGILVKSGTLDQVSALAGVLPSEAQGLVWFTLLNNGGDVEQFRHTQEVLLQKMAAEWGTTESIPLLTPTLTASQQQVMNEKL